MIDNGILLSDDAKTSECLLIERLKGGPVRTEIDIYEDDVLKETVSNRVVVTGAMLNALKLFDVESPIHTPTYNEEMELQEGPNPGTITTKDNFVCLFCCDDSGCGSDPDDIYVANFIDRIKPAKNEDLVNIVTDHLSDKIFPFRFVDASTDISADLRKYYFGRKQYPASEKFPGTEIVVPKAYRNKVAYYFKRFSTEPQLHVQYADGTQIVGPQIYRVATNQACEVYIETQLVINKDDFKDYFEQVLTWPKARVSSVSLVHAFKNTDDTDGINWYHNITPYTKLNFSYRLLQSLTSGLRFVYRIYY
jgi:hypothetical protein